jgi:ferredoxin
MEQNDLNQWLIDEATRFNCNLIGFAELTSTAQREILYSDYYIDDSPASYVIVLLMVLEDPIQDCWTQSPLWLNGKNYIDDAIARVATNLAFSLSKQGFPSRTLAYDSAYLKNLAVYAGLGIIGRNNLLITPQYGPHVRLRGLLTQAPLSSSESLVDRFDPCAECPEPLPCVKACPAGAFQTSLQSSGMQEESEPLPPPLRSPRSGYDKSICRNYSMGHLKEIGPFTFLWCRACEEACPVGKSNTHSKP